ncbi:MAG: transposase, partial [Lentisphaeria bacterium]
MRLPRPQIEQCCVHVTHRCQERRFLLRFAADRRQYRRRLFEATLRFPLVKILDYVITSNHVHLLAWVRRMQDLSDMMHWLQGVA